MFGDSAVSKIYCGNTVVWERNERVLPDGYTAIDGRSMNISAFNTNFRPVSGVLKVEAQLTIINNGSYMILVGGFNSDPYDLRNTGTVQIGYMSSTTNCRFYTNVQGNTTGGFTTNVAWSSYYTGSEYEITATASSEKSTITVNGDYTEFIPTYPISVLERDVWIGCNGDPQYGGTLDWMIGTIHYLKLYDGDTIARDFVPAKRDADDQEGLYDFITQQFYY